MKPNNPFLITGYHSPYYFCDREYETTNLIDALNNGRNVTLIAPRRIGKTGLIQHVFHKQQATDIVTVYMDIFSTQNLNDFVRLFASAILGKLDSISTRTFERIGKFVKSCRPTLTFDELTGTPKISVEIAPQNEEATLQEIFEYIRSSEKECYIAIDEFQQITEYPEKGVEALLRSYIQFVPNAHFIFAGSKQHVMQEMFLSAKRPFYQSTQLLHIGCIEFETYYRFASAHFAEREIILPKEIFEYIYNRFEGHTWYIQHILNRLYSYSCDIDKSKVICAIEEIISESAYAYENLMKAYPTGCVRLLKAIAREGCVKELTSGKFITTHQLKAASSVKTSISKLIDNELVYSTEEGYIVYDRFMNEWLKRV